MDLSTQLKGIKSIQSIKGYETSRGVGDISPAVHSFLISEGFDCNDNSSKYIRKFVVNGVVYIIEVEPYIIQSHAHDSKKPDRIVELGNSTFFSDHEFVGEYNKIIEAISLISKFS